MSSNPEFPNDTQKFEPQPPRKAELTYYLNGFTYRPAAEVFAEDRAADPEAYDASQLRLLKVIEEIDRYHKGSYATRPDDFPMI